MATALSAAAPARERTTSRDRVVGVFRATPFTYATLIIVSAVLCVPLVFVVSIALSSDQTVNANTFTIFPHEFGWDNFARVFGTELPMQRFLLNSMIISAGAVIGQVLSSGLVGYAFARLRAPGKNALFIIVIATMMIPAQITMIPQFILFKELGWVNTYLPLIVPNFFSNAFNVFLVRQFVSRLPSEIDEAAMVDGLTRPQVLLKVLLPLARPGMLVAATFGVIFVWNEFLVGLYVINSQDHYTIPIAASSLLTVESPIDWNIAAATGIFTVIPILLFAIVVQRYIVRGITAGAVR
jgi:multiple sugar transport system permease protein